MSHPDLKIELVFCAYNNVTQLALVLNAIAQQQVSDTSQWGVLVVNNSCTDGTTELVERAIATGKNSYLRMVRENAQGLTPARLCGVTQTTAQWIAFADDDCVLQPSWVAQTIAIAAQHSEAGASGGRVMLTWETPPAPFVRRCGYSFAEQDRGMQVQDCDCLMGADMVVNRKALEVCGWTKRR